MLSFKQLISEKSADIRKSDLMNSKTYDEALEKINSMPNVRQLGSGMYAIAFGGEGRLVVKLADDTDGTYHYLKEIYDEKLWISNPHFPRVAFLKQFEKHHRNISQPYITIMEILDFDSHWIGKLGNGDIYLIGKAYSGYFNPNTPYYKDWLILEKLMPKMKEVFDLIYSIDKNSADLGFGNIGYRYSNKKLVITDPLA